MCDPGLLLAAACFGGAFMLGALALILETRDAWRRRRPHEAAIAARLARLEREGTAWPAHLSPTELLTRGRFRDTPPL